MTDRRRLTSAPRAPERQLSLESYSGRIRTLSAVRPLSSGAALGQAPAEPPDLSADTRGRELFDFQKRGIEWLATRARGLLCDEMGLGKTAQALRAIRADRGAIVVCPASLRLVWRDECLAWRPDLAPRPLPPGDFDLPDPGEVAIVSYESLPEPDNRRGFGLVSDPRAARVEVVVDEAHYCKNFRGWTRGARRALKVHLLAKQARRAFGLTGTPLPDRPRDLWGVTSCFGLSREVFGTWERFCELFGATRRFVGRGESARSFVEFPAEGADAAADVRHLLAPVMLRRFKRDVAPDLPPKVYQDVPCEVDAELSAELDAIGARWGQESDLPPIEAWSAVRERLAASRVPEMLETVERYEDEGAPLVVFSAHRAPVLALAGRPGWGVITGDTGESARRTLVDAYQSGLLSGLALTIAAGGVGITLTRGSAVLFVDLALTPAENVQAEDRVVRIGQTASSVLVMRMVADHPVDRRVLATLDEKARLIARAVGS